MSQGFGWRAKIGQLYPSGGQCDFETQIMAPEGVQFVTTRLPFRKTGLEDDAALVNDIEKHASLCADAEVDLMLLNCTAAGIVVGPEVINARVEQATGVKSTTTIEAVMAGMKAAKFRYIGLMTPYPQEVVDHEVEFLSSQGYDVVVCAGTPCGNPVDQGRISPAQWVETAKSMLGWQIDGLLVSCAGIQISGVIGQIESLLGVPVVASNQAAVWHCLRMLNIEERPKQFGALLAGKFD
ncbi:maleate cis-trans isomerase family protein [Paraburkholderia sp. ZP32-5]|uniref:maleate cis-trans isomerase family protein n=1 Tax=Paraburkholderia sp. ZP32-5 TaxID=2883245 RepID=UPI003FA38EB1